MSPIRDLAAQCGSLANDYGTAHGAGSPATFEVAIFHGDPMGAGTELAATTDGMANGYARVTVANTDAVFPAPDPVTGQLTTTPIVFDTATLDWPLVGTHWALIAAGDVMWDCAAFRRTERVVVNVAGVTPAPVLVVFYNNLTE